MQGDGYLKGKTARRELRRAIRKAKRDCWNWFLQEADSNKVSTTARYTTPRINKRGKTLIRENGTITGGHWERGQVIFQAHFPPELLGTFKPAGGGQVFERVDVQLVGSLLKMTANTSATGDDRISVEIVKMFWQ